MLGGCADDLGSVARRHGVPSSAIVRLADDFAVGARASAGVDVVAFAAAGDRWSADVIAGDDGGEMVTHLVTMGGDTAQEWNSFFFGTAPKGASRVVVESLTATGGQVVDGTWVLAFRERELAPAQLSWRVLDAIGGIIASGTGLTP
jgi:hypothetical protein